MRVLTSRFPLLVKELQEQAVRRRLAVIRTILAIVAYLFFVVIYAERVSGRGSRAFGAGEELFVAVIVMQFFAVFFVLPAQLAGSITQEKETDSLQLLIVSKLTPAAILVQKLFSRVVPFFGYLSLTFPLLGLAYSLGGVESWQVVGLMYAIALTTLNAGCFTLMVSTWCATTVGAFLLTFALGFIVYFGPLLLVEALDAYEFQRIAIKLNPVGAFVEGYRVGLGEIVSSTAVFWVTSVLYFVVARWVFMRRAFLKGENWLRSVFSRLDRLLTRANRLTGGKTLWRVRSELPGNRPVRWRELQRRALDQPHHVLRVSLLLLIPVVAIAVLGASQSNRYAREEVLSGMVFVLWGLGALVVTAMSANLVVVERARQTLEVLLTTPLETATILKEKMIPVRRWIWIFTLALAVVGVVHSWIDRGQSFRSWRREDLSPAAYLLGMFALVWIYLPLLAWISMVIGLRAKTRLRGTISAITLVALWQVVPFFVFILILISTGFDDEGASYILLVSPATFLVFWEFFDDAQELFNGDVVAPILINFVGYGALLYGVRRWCLRNADRWLGRAREADE